MEVVSIAGSDIALLAPDDAEYPPLLREIPDPPQQLYVRGDPALLLRPTLAIVGARRASAAGLNAASALAAAASEVGLAVCSGLALGIDGAAHRGALDAGGDTLAIMATGIDIIYPRRHRRLGEAIAQRGCLVTEFPPGEPPRAGQFPRRNRIISGLSLGVVVVEAALQSGSLITARLAAEQGREVFALPWSNGHGGGSGCLQLLRDGAKMVRGMGDILEELHSLYAALRERVPLSGDERETGGPGEHPLLALIGDAEVPVDQLVQLSGLPVAEVFAQLSALELCGAVLRGHHGYQRAV